MTSWIGDL